MGLVGGVFTFLFKDPRAKIIVNTDVFCATEAQNHGIYDVVCFWHPVVAKITVFTMFFPRASERRVLPIVGVCISSSHLDTFSS